MVVLFRVSGKMRGGRFSGASIGAINVVGPWAPRETPSIFGNSAVWATFALRHRPRRQLRSGGVRRSGRRWP